MAEQTGSALAPEDEARLKDFARACKAAARAVLLYPAAHPAIGTTLGRIVQMTSGDRLIHTMTIGVMPDTLQLDGKGLAKSDQGVTELAMLLHEHLVGELIVHPGGDLDAWRQFLLLLGRGREEVRAEGGIARVWATMAGRHVELREIDYAQVLRERTGGDDAAWDSVIANCLQGQSFDLDDEALKTLMDIAGDPERLGAFVEDLDARGDDSRASIGAKTAALLRVLRGILEAVRTSQPERLDPVMRNMAAAVGRLTPEGLMALMGEGAADSTGDTASMVNGIVSRMSDKTIARFVAQNVIASGTPTDRLAQAFQALVPDQEGQQRLLVLAREDVAASPMGQEDAFEGVWNKVTQKLLTSYSDKSFVSDAYARELSKARTQAIEIEHVNDDPPERITTWLSSIATSSLRALDLQLLMDLLRIEHDRERWMGLMTPVVSVIEDLLLVGDFDAAADLAGVLVRETWEGTKDRQQIATIAIDDLVARGAMLRHVVSHLATLDLVQFEKVKQMCVSFGEVLVRPLAEALSNEESSRTRDRLTEILVAFGAIGRRSVERLKSSPNAAVRRTAIYLLREFGGHEALPELTELLDDAEPQVQREAVRAILKIGTDRAYRILQEALQSGTAQSRESIMQSVAGVRDERATPLFAFIVSNISHRGALQPIYLRALEALGAMKDPDGIPALKDALYRGEWWAARRNALLRSAAAAALQRIGTPDALDVLRTAADSGPRGVRTIARQYASAAAPARAARG